jgi:hypothetical protein
VRIGLLVSSAALAACAAGPRLEPVTAATACRVEGVGSGTSPWRQVRGAGFTYCVPPDWQPEGKPTATVDPTSWSGLGGRITWGFGPAPVIEGSVVVAMPVNEVNSLQPPCPQPWRADEAIGGRSARLSDFECLGTHNTTALFYQPTMYFQGTARNAATAQVELAVFRSVRFAARAP